MVRSKSKFMVRSKSFRVLWSATQKSLGNTALAEQLSTYKFLIILKDRLQFCADSLVAGLQPQAEVSFINKSVDLLKHLLKFTKTSDICQAVALSGFFDCFYAITSTQLRLHHSISVSDDLISIADCILHRSETLPCHQFLLGQRKVCKGLHLGREFHSKMQQN